MAVPAEQPCHTFADYLGWDESERAELLDGCPIMMAPPSTFHQAISVELTRQLANFLEGKKCRVFHAPFAVRLFEKDGDAPESVHTVFEPDLAIVCDKDKLDKHGCKGAPDMVIEILSPSSQRHDRFVKLNQYQWAGVREYWIVSPEDRTVQVYTLEKGMLIPSEFYGKDDVAKVNVLEGCFVELSKVFAE